MNMANCAVSEISVISSSAIENSLKLAILAFKLFSFQYVEQACSILTVHHEKILVGGATYSDDSDNGTLRKDIRISI